MTGQPPVLPDTDSDQSPPSDSGPTERVGTEEVTGRDWLAIGPIRFLVAVGIPAIGFMVLWWVFKFLRDSEANRILIVAVAMVVGVIGIFGLYWGMDVVNNTFPSRIGERVRPWIFVGPALAILSLYLVWPAVRTFWLSFLDQNGESFVGLDNYIFALTDEKMLTAFRNTVIWLVLGTTLTVGLGLTVASLVDRLKPRPEKVAKSIIFVPMAISFVGASVVWGFIYTFRPSGRPQIGLLNAIWTWLGNEPVFWLRQQPWNTVLLIIVLVWLQTGFSMVILSAAIKGVPEDILEAARIDGAAELQVFWRIVIPTIKSTIVVVTTTMIILILKVFDIVWVMTSGEFGTDVIATNMIRQAFRFFDDGRGAAIAVVLLIVVIPVMVLNVRRFREEEAMR
ncbi:MAG: sugar ABC transporter permease [Actinomycetota bacterium]|nr:sugar ABC transporter permease [Actinomycetota bacterium]